MRKKRPCSICRKWFLPDARVKDRQRTCSAPQCQAARRKKTQAAWREAHPSYFVAHRIQQRAAATPEANDNYIAPPAGPIARPPPPRMPPPLDRLPWDLAQDEFGAEGADFIGVFGRVLLRVSKDQSASQGAEMT